MVVGMCLGWGLGAAAMRAALASRNQLVLKQSLLREQQRCVHRFQFPGSLHHVYLVWQDYRILMLYFRRTSLPGNS